ncbi:MAG: hypothetical protein JWM85_671 [Acidimicrobiaceae bacterium]|nr:hypothetical protein [Acidimicrobiaceae bacterium]
MPGQWRPVGLYQPDDTGHRSTGTVQEEASVVLCEVPADASKYPETAKVNETHFLEVDGELVLPVGDEVHEHPAQGRGIREVHLADDAHYHGSEVASHLDTKSRSNSLRRTLVHPYLRCLGPFTRPTRRAREERTERSESETQPNTHLAEGSAGGSLSSHGQATGADQPLATFAGMPA